MFDAGRSISMTRNDRRQARVLEDLFYSYPNKEITEACDVVLRMQDLLGNYTPALTYLGAIEGDGAMIGVWTDHDQIDEEERTGNLHKSNHPPNHESVGDGYDGDYWLYVNDHGNETLYRRLRGGRWGNWAVVWSVV